jgi:hypothetical protein
MEQLALALLLLLLPALFFLASRVRAEKTGDLRSVPGLEELPGLVGRSAETGQPIHVSVGVAGVGGLATAETWAGLTVLNELANEAAACDTPLIVTVADPTVLPLAQDLLWRAYQRNVNPEGYQSTQVHFVAPEPLAYAATVAGILQRESLTANVMVGAFGDEYLLMGEAGAQHQVHQIAGTSAPGTLPFVYATSDETLIGEEIFAGGAYTTKSPVQVASLLTEDWARWAVIAGIVVLTVLRFVV